MCVCMYVCVWVFVSVLRERSLAGVQCVLKLGAGVTQVEAFLTDGVI